ncbi:MAG TPA: molybdopterin oxidoreductase family protein [Thermoleophilaceae bacterium]|jgi:anaerobic selenocysteine-containing dehydrogenase|nr:molybdopterin oxidoreductase family protein [Thermoleophilaceae bacterium]
MATRLVHAACPHDCPDTCAMHVTVEDGRATKVAGDPDHPITVGFLCGKVSNYLDRVYSDERILHPLIRAGAKGEARFRRASWDEALDRVAAGLRAARVEHGGESILPYSYAGTQGLIQGDTMSARVMNALGATDLERTICASAGIAGTTMAHGFSPEVDPEEWPRARYVIVWGWNPMSTAPHLWRKLLDARKAGAKIVAVDPFRSRTARVADEHLRPLPGTDAALGMGMMRAIVDAGLQDEDWCRRHAEGYDELLAKLADFPVERAEEITGVEAGTIALVGREFASTRPALLRLGVGAQRHLGAPAAYATLASLPALTGAWRDRGGGCSYIPKATAAAVSEAPLQRVDLRPGPVRRINMSQLGRALTDRGLDPPVKAMVCWNSNPAAVAPDQDQVLAGLGREDLFTVVLEQFLTDTAAHADVVLPATTQLEHLDVIFSWGHHYLTWSEPAIDPLGEAKPNTETFRLIAERLGLTEACFADTDEELVAQLLSGFEEDGLRERGWQKIDLGQGPVPHAEGGFGTQSGKVALRAGYEPPAEVTDTDLAERFPLALLTPKTHLFLNSTFANQRRQHAAQPEPEVVVHPADAAARGIVDGGEVRVWNERGSFSCAARVSEDARPGVLVAPMGWWNRDYRDGRSAQATTSQVLTATAHAPIFNDNRVEAEAL